MGKKLGGIDKLREQAVAFVRERICDFEPCPVGDSPIEKLFYTALQTHVAISSSCFNNVVHITGDEQLERYKDYEWCRRCLLMQSQVQLEGWRVDFILHFWTWGTERNADPGWVSAVIECDGHDFHERTKEQAARDRSRDRAVQQRELKVFRFTGSEIWNDPWGCAEEIIRYAQEGQTF